MTVTLNTQLAPDLEAEGKARELIRSIQKLRKEAGLQVGDIAVVEVPADAVPNGWEEQISAATHSTLKTGQFLRL